MDEILELQKQLMAAQMQDASHRLSHRNCVELILMMMRRGDIKLLHTNTGREYLTHEQLEKEINDVIHTNGGRISLLEIQQACDVSVEHVQAKVDAIVKRDRNKQLLAGEVITKGYLDGVAEEINEKLQNEGRLEITRLAQEFDLPATFALELVRSRLGDLILGRVQSTQLYTDAYVARLRAQVRGALHAATGPVALQELVSDLELNRDMAVAEARTMVKEGKLPGTLSGGSSRPVYTPSIHRAHQRSLVEATWAREGYLPLARISAALRTANPRQYARERFPGALLLQTCVVGEAIVSQVASAVRSCLEGTGGSGTKAFTCVNVEDSVRLPPIGAEESAALVARVAERVCRDAKRPPGSLRLVQATYVVPEEFLEAQAKRCAQAVEERARALHLHASSEEAAAEAENDAFRDEGDPGRSSEAQPAAAASGGRAQGKKGGKNRGGKGERGQMRREKKMKQKKGKKGKGKHQEPAESEPVPEEMSSRASRKSKQRGGSSHQSRKGTKGKSRAKAAPVSFPTRDIIEILRKSWEGHLDLDFVTEISTLIRPKVNAMLRAALAKLQQQAEGKQRGMHEQVVVAIQEIADHFAIYHQTILGLRGKNKENQPGDQELESLLQAYLLKTLGSKALDILLNNELLYTGLKLPGSKDGENKAAQLVAPRTATERMWILDHLPKAKSDVSTVLKQLMACVKSRDTEAFIGVLHMASSVCSLRLRKIDGKKLRNLVFNIRRGMMAKLKDERNPKLIFQYAILILHSQLSSGVLHIPTKAIPRLIDSIMKGAILEETFTALKRVEEILEELGPDFYLPPAEKKEAKSKAETKGGGEVGDTITDEEAGEKLKKLRAVASKFGIKRETIQLLLDDDMDDEDLKDLGEDDLVDDMGIPSKQAKLVIKAINAGEDSQPEDSNNDDGLFDEEDAEEEEKKKAQKALRDELQRYVEKLKSVALDPKTAILRTSGDK